VAAAFVQPGRDQVPGALDSGTERTWSPLPCRRISPVRVVIAKSSMSRRPLGFEVVGEGVAGIAAEEDAAAGAPLAAHVVQPCPLHPPQPGRVGRVNITTSKTIAAPPYTSPDYPDTLTTRATTSTDRYRHLDNQTANSKTLCREKT
jgi:hypothetical protein